MAIIHDPRLNRPLNVIGDTIILKAIGQADWSAFTLIANPPVSPPVHTHPWEEAFWVRRGRLRVHVAGQDHLLGVDECVTIAAGTPHSYLALEPGTEATVLFGSTRPVAFFEAIDSVADIDRVLALAAVHEVEVAGPPLRP
jgi:mannose-6-phosphate isomerase-like protein (cupin superfamily)